MEQWLSLLLHTEQTSVRSHKAAKKNLVANSLTQVAAAPSPDQSKVQPKKSLHQPLVALNPKSYKTDSLFVLTLRPKAECE